MDGLDLAAASFARVVAKGYYPSHILDGLDNTRLVALVRKVRLAASSGRRPESAQTSRPALMRACFSANTRCRSADQLGREERALSDVSRRIG